MAKFDPHDKRSIAYACLIPITVLLSGLFAGLTLGYMSLDETQLNVLSISGTPKQREYANKIKPIRKNGHLLLVTLLLANMIVNESLPLIADNVLGSGVQSLIISTVLIVIFSEVIPQSVFTRHGLYLGAKMAFPTKILIYSLGIVSWPIAKILEFALGPHHGIIYRRAELKELIALHSHGALHGGDLKNDTVTIIGATLDLQEKVVKQAMTPISDVFMLSIDSKLDYETLKKICLTGHSRVPVYEEVDVPVQIPGSSSSEDTSHLKGLHKSLKGQQRFTKAKKIVGILLVKQCVLLDPKDAVPLRKIPLNKVPFVPNNEPLLGILDKFQEGRSHIAIVSRFSVEKAASVKQAVKRGLTQRLMQRVGIGESSDSDSDDNNNSNQDEKSEKRRKKKRNDNVKGNDIEKGTDGEEDILNKKASGVNGDVPEDDKHDNDHSTGLRVSFRDRGRSKRRGPRRGDLEDADNSGKEAKGRRPSFQLAALEQSMPADAVLTKESAHEFLLGFDPAVNPLGIITLEDVLEELIGEEIYDEFDPQGAHADLSSYVPPAVPTPASGKQQDTPQSHLPPTSPTPAPQYHGISHHVASVLHLGTTLPKARASDQHQQVQNDLNHVGKEEHGQSDAVINKSSSDMANGAVSAVAASTASVATTGVNGGWNVDGRRPTRSTASAGATATNTIPVLMMPIALRGLYFLRSRSAPPTPREEKKVFVNLNTAARGGSESGPTTEERREEKVASETGTEAVAMETCRGAEEEEKVAIVQAPQLASAPSLHTSPVTAPIVVPTLEAILLDRKRRLAALGTSSSGTAGTGSGTASVAGTASTASLPVGGGSNELRARTMTGGSGKGTRFKSSPLGGSGAVGVVVAEKVKEDILGGGDGGVMRAEEDGRIPSEEDKEGDKE